MARRGDEAQAEALEIVEGIVERMDFQLAAVAGAGIDLADREAAAEPAPRGAIDAAGELGQRRIVRARAAPRSAGGACRLSNRILRMAMP